MPAAVAMPKPATPAKRVLAETTSARRNIVASPNSAKKRKLHGGPENLKNAHGSFGSSQPKSQFEEEVLEKLTQDISGLKQKNAEKDQQWARPSLDDFDPKADNLIFQSIDAEEGTLHGGQIAVKLFGVTDVSLQ